MDAVTSFCGLCLLLVIGKLLRVKIPLLQKLYLPSSVIGGIIGLILLHCCGDFIPAGWYAGWHKLPGFLINIVFAALFLGVQIPGISKIWRTAGPQLAYGQIVAWGQYVVGIGIVLILLKPLFKVPDAFGVIIPVGFEGGHGTAGGLSKTFTELGWAAGSDFGLASATVGMIAAIVIGMALINWAVNKGYVQEVRTFDEQSPNERMGIYPKESRPKAGVQTVFPDSIDSLAFHLAMVGIAVLMGYGMKYSLAALDNYMPAAIQELKILQSFPLFPLCMIGGLLLQLFFSKTKVTNLIDHGLMQRISGTALDFLVVAAVSTIKLQLILDNFMPFILLVTAGILWNIFCVLWLSRRILPNYWFERSVAEMGQSMGVTATGLLLLRTVDPEAETEAPAAFGYKQLLHEPFMGGGLWTSLAVPLAITRGGWPVLLISMGAIVIWLLICKLLWGRGRNMFKAQ
jgi:ESS family glutamate:Na+ symporter